MEKIAIIGCPGAGKSTAARRLAQITGLPLIHLDRHYWQPGWVRMASAQWRATVQSLADGPCWIMDGNYSGTLDIRLRAADTIILLDYPTLLCLFRVLKRMSSGQKRMRDGELGPKCPERLDWRFLWFVLTYRLTHRARDVDRLAGFDGTVLRFRKPGELEVYLNRLQANATIA